MGLARGPCQGVPLMLEVPSVHPQEEVLASGVCPLRAAAWSPGQAVTVLQLWRSLCPHSHKSSPPSTFQSWGMGEEEHNWCVLDFPVCLSVLLLLLLLLLLWIYSFTQTIIET